MITGVSASRADYGIHMDIPSLPLFVPAEARAAIADLAVSTIRLALQYIAGAISARAPVDTGGLAQSFAADPAGPTGGIDISGTLDAGEFITGRVFSSLPHAIVMESGRRAGYPISREGIDAIGLWAQRKLGMSEDEANDAKWAIANVIVAQGIEGRYYIEAGLEDSRGPVEAMFAELGGAIRDALLDLGEGGARAAAVS